VFHVAAAAAAAAAAGGRVVSQRVPRRDGAVPGPRSGSVQAEPGQTPRQTCPDARSRRYRVCLPPHSTDTETIAQ